MRPVSKRPPFPEPPEWYDQFRVVGVTGTNGKTSTATFAGAALGCLSREVVLSLTVGLSLGGKPQPGGTSFPRLFELMQRSRDAGGNLAVFEVTSEVLARGFAARFAMHSGIFTNLSHDHLDAHGSPEHYLASKAQLFAHLQPGGFAVLNGCDPASELIEEVIPKGVAIVRYGVASRGAAYAALDFEASSVELSWQGTRTQLVRSVDGVATVATRAMGEVFAENALAAFALAVSLGVPAQAAAEAIASVPPPPGRFEVVAEHPHVVIDFAHTPDAIERTLRTARSLCRGKLTIVFGAGGNRDPRKRTPMGTAAQGADRILLTSDNPRSEDPKAIAEEMARGISDQSRVEVVLDRRAAIERALLDAGHDDVVLIAGRGHETKQLIGDQSLSFSDVEVASEIVAQRNHSENP